MKIDINKLLDEINSLGYSMTSSSDIMKIGKSDTKLIPLLIEWLQKASVIGDKELIVRSLGVKGFSEASNVLLDEFEASDKMMYKWAIGSSLLNIQDKSTKYRLIRIASDNSHGMSRQMIIVALGKMKIEEALPTLISLLEDNQEVGHVIYALSYYKKNDLIEVIKPYTNHNEKWVQKEANKAIKKLEKLL